MLPPSSVTPARSNALRYWMTSALRSSSVMTGSLSVLGPYGNGPDWLVGVGAGWLAASRRRAPVASSVERPQPTARTNDLDASKDRRKLWRPATAAQRQVMSATSAQARGGQR